MNGTPPTDLEDDDGPPMVVVCAGPPACRLMGDAAVQAQIAGCVWCKRIIVHGNGRETETGPGHA